MGKKSSQEKKMQRKRGREDIFNQEMRMERKLRKIQERYPDELIERVCNQLKRGQGTLEIGSEKEKRIKEIYWKVKKGETIDVSSHGMKKMWIATKIQDELKKK